MPELRWQKSTHSPDTSNCVYIAATPDGTIHLRESDDHPGVALTTTPDRFHALIRTLKATPN